MTPVKVMRFTRLQFILRLAKLRGDERASVTLLTGMMVFLAAIFGIITIDTSMAIHNRIVTQNAVDSAADAAALWQARGCNMLQELNNLHYDVDEALAIAEGISAGACIASTVLLAAELAADIFFGAGEALRPVRYATCNLGCNPLPLIDYLQDLFYQAIMPIQQAIVDATPYVAFGYANACAKGAGADPLAAALPDALNGVLAQVGLNLPSLSSIGGGVSGVLGSIPIYAMPLDPDSFGLFDPKDKGLFVTRRNNDGNPPLKWPELVGQIGDAAGVIGCSDALPIPYPEAKDAVVSSGWDGNWGWDDQYFFGHPGFSTWIAGKTHRDELLALGNLRWLNGGTPPAEMDYMLGQSNLPMFNDSVTSNNGTPLTIPGFLALASSQVEGTPVVEHGDVDARGKLIKVFLPSTSGGSPTAVDTAPYFIYH